ncbi:hypothetical protein Ddye_023791 [Dipteronia dyeriana]|uniref:Uncharacterized protein n=1 Tax=Dipteronia dyeriana TaxID=168575 RepID=A0AAD9TU81_9ROSI|nr:hypothetical protein Ddye_023791 [Dipteronia dyeriana]
MVRNPHPKTEPKPEKSIPKRRIIRFTLTNVTPRPNLNPNPPLMSSPPPLAILMPCFRAEATRLEKRKQLKEYTWQETRLSATAGPAEHGGETRVVVAVVVVVGYNVSPRKSPKVKSELTLMMPSKAMMWMVVVLSFFTSDMLFRRGLGG